MLFCPSFTQSERFLQTDQLIIRLQVVVVTNFIRILMRSVFVNVFKSDAVIWWAAFFRGIHPPEAKHRDTFSEAHPIEVESRNLFELRSLHPLPATVTRPFKRNLAALEIINAPERN